MPSHLPYKIPSPIYEIERAIRVSVAHLEPSPGRDPFQRDRNVPQLPIGNEHDDEHEDKELEDDEFYIEPILDRKWCEQSRNTWSNGGITGRNTTHGTQ